MHFDVSVKNGWDKQYILGFDGDYEGLASHVANTVDSEAQGNIPGQIHLSSARLGRHEKKVDLPRFREALSNYFQDSDENEYHIFVR